ncbi:leucyl/phenylalanyl-tRNA--protein transferase [uncultured Eudoraea sp.]|uniref:leucyl/phenylalanyl-tRNA--protein transferase n=1 Tax=uncultured Eudoraea sp. TaxID=1035614 RepID=UPI002623F8AB|nr:leucyl/phenylalanyl-tRNA--protein transferase [uncultured Eudoraea sp.]
MKKKNSEIYFLTDRLEFPPADNANGDGLLAVGGDLSPARLLLAYKSGIFPWFNEDSLILWWSPDPRMVLFPQKIRISKSMRHILSGKRFRLTRDKSFKEVIENCADIERTGQEGTWITDNMKEAYLQLHQQGIARSYEVWEEGKLVGGLYGIDLGQVFCGESMFSKTSNASKYAFIHLAKDLEKQGYKFIDCQVYNRHLESLGAEEIPRKEFLELLQAEVK